ncbi:TPA: hypothetical protein N0F65_012631 [Lagenidium giganteum]|uniref:MI domain-containing protein n=1 Tax=Lagenidium giganteum TaxID=4803 RepID=A0AAV2YBC9_9STRA|nr:TPA: hypothetical protein N0F65_012631 [Lagenidium giganteum]
MTDARLDSRACTTPPPQSTETAGSNAPVTKLRATAKSFVFNTSAPVWQPGSYTMPAPAPAAAPAPAVSDVTKKSVLKPSAKAFVPSFALPVVAAPAIAKPTPPVTPVKEQPASDKDDSAPCTTEPESEDMSEPSPASPAKPQAAVEDKAPVEAAPAPVEQVEAPKAEEQQNEVSETTSSNDNASTEEVSAEQEVVRERIMYTIAQLLELEPEDTPIPESVLATPVIIGKKDKNAPAVDDAPRGGRSRRGDSGRGLSRQASSASDRDREGRGGRGGSRRGGRGGRGNVHDTAPALEDCVPLQINEETRWKPSHAKAKAAEEGDVATAEVNEASLKEAKSILNKLSVEKFEKLSNQLIEVAVRNVDVLSGVIEQVVEKAQMEWHFSTMYAELCAKLSTTDMPAVATDDDKVHDTNKLFRKLLLTRCQKQFEVQPSKDGLEELPEDVRLEKELLLKRATLGHIRFIGELYKQSMLSSRIMHTCIQSLFGDLEKPDEESLECLTKLLSTIGEKLESTVRDEAESGLVGQYYTLIKQLSQDSKRLSTRVRFMLQDLLELRRNRWVARRKETKAMTIAEVHAEVAREAKEKAKSSTGNSRERGLQRSQSMMAPSSFSSERRRGNSTGAASSAWKARAAAASTPEANDGWETAGNGNSRPKLVKSRSSSDRFGSAAPPRAPLSRGNSFAMLARQDSTGGRKERGRSSSSASNSGKRGSTSPDAAAKPPVSPPKPAKEAMPAADFEKRAKSVFQEYMVNADLDDAVQYFVDMASEEHHPLVPTVCLNFGLEKGENEREAVSKFLAGLFEREILTKEAVANSLQELLEFAEDMEIDIPLTLPYIGHMIAPSLIAGAVTLPQLIEQTRHFQNGKAAKFVGKTLARVKLVGNEDAVKKVIEDVSLATVTGDEGLEAFYAEYDLQFLA